jgi:opacity protein-like surface antigen
VVNVNRRIGAEGNFGGYYKTIQILNVGTFGFHDYVAMGGARFNVSKIFLHGLIGIDHLSGSSNFFAAGATASDNAIAAAMGGGVQWKVARHVAIRASADYFLSRFGAATQNNIRISTAVVFDVGSIYGR